jgi:hypothetical protein
VCITDYHLIELAHRLHSDLSPLGVAIALRSGDGAITCRAAAGEVAPPPGTVLAEGEGVTWACISTGAEIICADVEHDERVNAALCRALGVGSLLLVPIQRDGECIGLVEAMFSDALYAEGPALQALREAAAGISEFSDGSAASASSFATENPAEEKEFVAESTPSEAPVVELRLATAPQRRRVVPLIAVGVMAIVALLGALMLTRATSEDPAAPSSKAAPAASSSTSQPASSAGGASTSSPSPQADFASQPVTQIREAAAGGNADAQYELASRLESAPFGDRVEACAWYVVASLGGSASADAAFRRLGPQLSDAQIARVRLRVGDLYAEGKALPRDPVQAYRWFYLADTAGNTDARSRMAQLSSSMTSEQVAAATADAQKWLARHRP